MSCLPKPVLRGHLIKYVIKNVVVALTASVTSGSLYYFLVKKPYERDYENYMKNYDSKEHMNNLVKWGYIQSLSTDYSE